MVREWRGELVVLKNEVLGVFLFKKTFMGLVAKGAVVISLALVLRSCCVRLRRLNWTSKKRRYLFCQKESCSRFLEAYAT